MQFQGAIGKMFGAWDTAADWLNEWFASLTERGVTSALAAFAGGAGLVMGARLLRSVLARDRGVQIYIRDFEVLRPDDSCMISTEDMLRLARTTYHYSSKPLTFMRKVSINSGLGDRTYMPLSIRDKEITLEAAREEAQYVMFNTVDSLLRKTGVSPADVGIVVTNCSLFCPTPSLSAMLVNRFGFPEDVRTFSLGGMGCSASIIGLDMIKGLLSEQPYHRRGHGERRQKNEKHAPSQPAPAPTASGAGYRLPQGDLPARSAGPQNPLSPNKPNYALLVSFENMTLNFYDGFNRSMLMPNILFRLGCAAVLLTADPTDAKYRLRSLVRTHIGDQDDAYRCIYQTEDDVGKRGVYIGKDVPKCAGRAMTQNVNVLFRDVLCLREKLGFAKSMLKYKRDMRAYKKAMARVGEGDAAGDAARDGGSRAGSKAGTADGVAVRRDQVAQGAQGAQAAPSAQSAPASAAPGAASGLPEKPRPPVPSITRSIQHMCFHTGGRAVIDELQKLFALEEAQVAASRATLYRYGNTSSSSVWYELAYHESTGAVKPGDNVWQIAFGSGFKCNSAVWQATPNIRRLKPTAFDAKDPNFTWEKAKRAPMRLSEAEATRDYEIDYAAYVERQNERDFAEFLRRFGDRVELREGVQLKSLPADEVLGPAGPADAKEVVASQCGGEGEAKARAAGSGDHTAAESEVRVTEPVGE